MHSRSVKEYNLKELAQNGLRRGLTTGTCATAATRACLYLLLLDEKREEVDVSLVDPEYFVSLEIKSVERLSETRVRCEVIKDAGDDPDQTHKATLFVEVEKNNKQQIIFKRGVGVGLVTQPGIQVPVGEPAINPGPRQMMIRTVADMLSEADCDPTQGFDITVGCVNGEEIARKTFNPRLGIEGGISILGTTGIVEPKSLASFKASIEVYIRVALGEKPQEIIISPGNLGKKFGQQLLKLPLKQIVQISNFIGYALEKIDIILQEDHARLSTLWVVGHPGKLMKVLSDQWDTHSSKSKPALEDLKNCAIRYDLEDSLLDAFTKTNTVEGVIKYWEETPQIKDFWAQVETAVAHQISKRLKCVDQVRVILFSMGGKRISNQELDMRSYEVHKS
ncbi:MAG: cobalt-precorrin-5B (C(1))-methyltransferase CbiD [Verrucomicrobiota bacterium]